MITLGINSFFEHPAVALLIDGEIVFAVEDERFTRIKHGKKYSPYKTYIPSSSIYAALKWAGINARDVDEIAYSYDPNLHLRSLWGCLTGARMSSLGEELSAYSSARNVARALRGGHEFLHFYRDRLTPGAFAHTRFAWWDHHRSHAASAYCCSGYGEALVVVADGSGEIACTSVYVARGSDIKLVARIDLPHSLGFFYSAITKHLGFEPFSDEYKVMGLGAYGLPAFAAEMDELLQSTRRGRYKVNTGALNNLERLFGPARELGEPLVQKHCDIAHSAQAKLQAVLTTLILYHVENTGLRNLCIAGGTFLNCVANGRIAKLFPDGYVFPQPAAHDAGTAIGAAALSWMRSGGSPQVRCNTMLLGTEWSEAQIAGVLRESRADFQQLAASEAIEQLAALLAEEDVLAIFRGRMEFGPRALGARSFIASPRSVRTREKLNEIKGREQFRPLAPLVTEEAYDRFFEGPSNRYMMYAVKARPETLELAPAVVHADGTSRAQIVRRDDDSFLHALLEAFERRTGVPILINTSLNVRGKPIDESPVDALCSFYTTGVDALFMANFLVRRRDLKSAA